jgi:uncharacterized protein
MVNKTSNSDVHSPEADSPRTTVDEQVNAGRQADTVDSVSKAVSHIESATGVKRVLFVVLAAFFFVLAVAGVVLPGLPTTPFLLLTSYFLVRSYPELNSSLLNSRIFGPIISDWQIRGGVRRDVKVKAISFVVIAVAITIYLSKAAAIPTMLVMFLACVGVGVIARLPKIDN